LFSRRFMFSAFAAVSLRICKTCWLKEEELCLYYAWMEDTWGVPRDPACDLCSGSRGHCPRITRGFNGLIFLLYSSMLAVYVAEVFSSSPVASFGCDGCTHSFFASGSTGFSSSYFVTPVVALGALPLGSP
jgi:hypothetical protein